MFNPRAYANSRPGGIAALEVRPAPGRRAAGETARQFVPLKRTVANGRWDGPLAEITLTQTYGYTRAQCDLPLEAIYRFPLPGDAAVRRVGVTFGDVEISADLRARAAAETEYVEAKARGRQAALVTAESPDVFTLRVAGLRPDEDVTVETTYVQLAEPEGSGWSLRIPLTTAPRFTRDDEPGGKDAQPLAVLRDPGHRFALDILTSAVGAIASSTHALDAEVEDGRRRVRLRERDVLPDRDCVLVWQPEREEARPTLRVLAQHDSASDQTYFVGLVAPPRAPARTIPREAIVLVDHSGSMSGAKWEAADWAALKALGDLAPTDRHDLGVFHNVTTWQDRSPRPAGADAVERGRAFLGRHRDSGGTELGSALEQALLMPREPGEISRQVVLITDAEVSDFARIIALVEEEARRADSRRVSVLCIDAAPNSFLAREIARKGGGVARFLTSSPEEGDITTALGEILESWTQPISAGLRLEIERAGVEAVERDVRQGTERDWSIIDLGDLTTGRPIWVVGRVPGSADGLGWRLVSQDGRAIAEIPASEAATVGAGAIGALFGAWKVMGLETLRDSTQDYGEVRDGLRRLGYDPEGVLGARTGRRTRYRENESIQTRDALEELLLKEALAYGLLCSETGFVAVRREAGKVVEETVAVGNALPTGWSEGFAGQVMASHSMAPSPASSPLHLRRAKARASVNPMTTGAAPQSYDMSAIPIDAETSSDAARADTAASASDDDVADVMHWLRAAHIPSAQSRAMPQSGGVVLFDGAPAFAGGEAVLFDTDRPTDAARLSGDRSLTRLIVEATDIRIEDLDPGLAILIFVGDLAAPVARVSLSDILRQGGRRPLSVRRRRSDRVVVVLADSAGAWRAGAPKLMVAIE